MPSLGAEMEAGTLVEWLKQPGDHLKRGDIIAVVETEKGAIEIEVFQEGVLEEHLAAPGSVLPVGAVMARISGQAAAEAPPEPAAPSPPPATMFPTPLPATGARATPAARQLAQERGIDLSTITGTGPGGSTTREDVAAAPAAAPRRQAAGYDFSAMRKAIAAAMARSKREIPHYYLSLSIDVGAAQDWLAAGNATRAPAERILIGALFVKAVARAAREFPEFNGFHDGERFLPSEAIHVGVAIAVRGGGLVAPALHDAGDLEVPTLMARMRDLVARVRAGRFRSSEIADPTITVTSLGDRGVDAVWGVIYPPQVAIVGFGRVGAIPTVTDGAVVARPVVQATLAADHRVSDGHRGALFLQRVSQLLSEPATL